MAGLDFPPNPEDGERWLPSDIINEITSGNVTHPNNTLLPHPTTHTVPPIAPNLEIRFGSFVTKTNEDGSACLSLHCGPDQLFSTPISIYNPFTPAKILQGFEEKREKVCVEKYGGTGVFLPRSVNNNNAAATSKKAVEEIDGGTGSGAFITHHQNKKKKSGKNEGSLETSNDQNIKNAKEEETSSQVQHPSGICLPKDWTY